MPTDVSTPQWRCEVCQAIHGERLDLAERCEAGLTLPEMAAGTPLLVVDLDGQYRMVPLTATGRVGTNVTGWTASREEPAVHSRQYAYPSPHAAGLIHVSDAVLRPARPGHLQVEAGRHSALRSHAGDGAGIRLIDLGERLGLTPTGGADIDRHSTYARVDPITPPVRAVLDLLCARLDLTPTRGYQRDRMVAAHVLWRTGGDGPKANAMLAFGDHDTYLAEATDLQRRWWSGEDVAAPRPWLVATSTRTPSTLTREIRSAVEATGVPWQPRTSASEYVRHLISTTLTTTGRADMSLFAGKPILAVGGNKGGTGKSTVSAALALALVGQGWKVRLVDADLDSPSQHILWDLPQAIPVSPDGTRLNATEVAPGLRVISTGQVAAGVLPDRWDGASTRSWLTFIGSMLDCDDADLILLDLPAGQGSVPQHVLGGMHPEHLLVVTTADQASIDAARSAAARHLHERHTVTVVENASVVRTPSGEQVRLHGGEGDVAALAEQVRATYAGSLPWEPNLEALAGTGEMARLAAVVTPAARGHEQPVQ